jgi:hypothetical protein
MLNVFAGIDHFVLATKSVPIHTAQVAATTVSGLPHVPDIPYGMSARSSKVVERQMDKGEGRVKGS